MLILNNTPSLQRKSSSTNKASVLRHIDSQTSANDLSKSVTVLDACYWIKNAVKGIKSSTVSRCFSRCGFQDTQVTTVEDEDDQPLEELIHGLRHLTNSTMTAEEFVNIDNDAPANEEVPVDWEAAILQDLSTPVEESVKTTKINPLLRMHKNRLLGPPAEKICLS